MIQTIDKIGDSLGIIIDSSLMEIARLKVGDEVNVTVQDGGAILVTPIKSTISPEEGAASARGWIEKNSELFHRLSK